MLKASDKHRKNIYVFRLLPWYLQTCLKSVLQFIYALVDVSVFLVFCNFFISFWQHNRYIIGQTNTNLEVEVIETWTMANEKWQQFLMRTSLSAMVFMAPFRLIIFSLGRYIPWPSSKDTV